MPTPKDLTKNEVIDWISYYEEGNELPDDIMVRMMWMAQQHSEREDVKKVLAELINEFRDDYDNARESFEETDCSESMHTMDHAEYGEATVRNKYRQIFGDPNESVPT